MALAQPATDPAERVRPRTWPAAVTLFFLAALIPETVATCNSPPLLILTRPEQFAPTLRRRPTSPGIYFGKRHRSSGH